MSKQSNPLAVFFADAHLDKYAWIGKPELSGDSFHAFEFICRWAVDHKVEFVFGGGDLVDVRTPPSEVIRFAREQMEMLYRKQIQFHYIQGQHELDSPPWLEAAHHWPQWLHKDAVIISGDYEVLGLDWQPADKLADELEAIQAGGSGSSIMLAHQVWEEFMGTHGQPEGSWAQVPIVDTLVTGDLHRNEHVRDWKYGASGQLLEIISPGSTNLREISEDPRKYFYVLYEGYTWKRVLIPGRVVIRQQVTEEVAFEELLASWKDTLSGVGEQSDKLPEQLRKPILQLIFSDHLKQFRKRAKAAFADTAHLFFKVLEAEEDESEEVQAGQVEQQGILDRGIEGCLELTVPKDHKHHAPLLRLIKAEDKKAELLKMKEERFGQERPTTGPRARPRRRKKGQGSAPSRAGGARR